eukprot:12881906-Prorocentrum_lima.AAC.1
MEGKGGIALSRGQEGKGREKGGHRVRTGTKDGVQNKGKGTWAGYGFQDGWRRAVALVVEQWSRSGRGVV